MGRRPYALQLYTVRDHLAQDVAGTLRRVNEMGYEHVEIAGTHGLTDGEFKGALDAAGLNAISAHMGYEEITGDPRPIVEAAADAGVAWYIVEQDTCARDSLESAAISAAFMAQK